MSAHSLTPHDLKMLKDNFIKCVSGYHLINDDPIKESPWEDINAIILIVSGHKVTSQSKGSHESGKDLLTSIGSFSNKSTQYTKDYKSFDISSYRLTQVCSDKCNGEIGKVIEEINKRKNFDYYSILVRNESVSEIMYDWYLIPSDYPPFDPSSYEWSVTLGKIGKNKGMPVGWNTNEINGSSMKIVFSMSSQLWITISVTEEMRKFIIASTTVTKGRKLNYIDLFEQYKK